MWKCSKCNEGHDESLDVCWSCGTTQDGKEDPEFGSAADYEATQDPSLYDNPLDVEIASRFVCVKCRNSGGSAQRFAATGTGLSKLMDLQYKQFIAVSCNRCGYTEIFNPDVLQDKSHLGTILDLIFGS